MVTALVGALLGAATNALLSPLAWDCRHDLLPTLSQPSGSSMPVAALDLARLRDFGRPDQSLAGEAPFSVSPDGRSVALVLRRGDPARDSYCIGVVIVDLSRRAVPRLVDVGGEFIVDASDVRGIPDLPLGTARPVTPRWSPDGLWLAYLRRDGDRTRVWRARRDGSFAEPVGTLSDDARDVHWSLDGRSLLIRTRPVDEGGRKALEEEGRQGYRYDGRFWTLSQSTPRIPLVAKDREIRIDADSGRAIPEPATSTISASPSVAALHASTPWGADAWTEPVDPSLIMGPTRLVAKIGTRRIACQGPACIGVGELWWLRDTLFFLQGPTPANGGTTSLYRWNPANTAEPRFIRSTLDVLLGCQPAGRSIVCAREAATQPRRLSRIDPATGRANDLFDPNLDFSRLAKGPATRLRWTGADGVTTYGDLVLPADHRAGQKHPLIIVLYHSRGFLRGGTGDEYPIQAFASRGYAVLSVERTPFVGEGIAHSFPQFMTMSVANFAERQRILTSIETGISRVLAMGVADPTRIGITGMSDGAATVQYALVNSTLFKAAAISSCCDEPSSSMFAADPGYGKLLQDAGFPVPGSDGSDFWKRYSLAANAARIRTPLLIQLPDDEFRLGLETYMTMKAHHVPTELYVFTDEFHQKWHPAHRLASYTRALDWFDYWLNGRLDNDGGEAARNSRWKALTADQPR